MQQKSTKRQVILDTETTGLYPPDHRIIEVACIEFENRRFTGKSVHYYVNPERDIDAGARAIHGISSEFLADKPLFKDIAKELFNFLKGAELIIHNAPFDLGFLDHEFIRLNKQFGHLIDYCGVIDTLNLARRLHPSQRNNLDALCKRYKVDNSHRNLHGALKDAQLLGEVYLRMTGGQTRFDIVSMQPKSYEQDVKDFFVKKSTKELMVIRANEEEQAAHQNYLRWLKGKGNCVWMEEEETISK